MRSALIFSLIAATTVAFVAPAGAAEKMAKMHSARVMVGSKTGAMGAYYEVQMAGKMYAMMPLANYEDLLSKCKAMQQC